MASQKNNKEESGDKKNNQKTSITLGKSLEDNVNQFKKIFQNDDTFLIRYFTNQEQAKARFCVLFIDGMVDVETANRNIIQPIVQSTLPKNFEGNMDVIFKQVVLSNHTEKSDNTEEMITRILEGESVVLMENCVEALIVCTKGWKSRTINEPQNEQVLRGPREGFVEPILVNLSLIRRRLVTPDLKFISLTIGKQTQTKISVCYIDGIVNRQILDEVLQRLNKINIDEILESGNLAELMKDCPYSPFKTIGSTERPDVVAANLLEGRIAIVVDGTPVVITMPFLLQEYFQTDDDYYINFYYSSINRMLRFLGFIITVTFPGIYVAILTFHQEMIPNPLLLSISAAREGIPFPTIVETLGLLIVFEIMREVGMRIPISVGQTISILGALVLGSAAVEARIVSATVIIVIALTGLTGLMTTRIKGPSIMIRVIFTLLAGFLGLYGLIFGIIGLFLHLCSIRSFGVPYMITFSSLDPKEVKDTFVRAPLWFTKTRPKFISGRNKVRQADRSK